MDEIIAVFEMPVETSLGNPHALDQMFNAQLGISLLDKNFQGNLKPLFSSEFLFLVIISCVHT